MGRLASPSFPWSSRSLATSASSGDIIPSTGRGHESCLRSQEPPCLLRSSREWNERVLQDFSWPIRWDLPALPLCSGVLGRTSFRTVPWRASSASSAFGQALAPGAPSFRNALSENSVPS